MRWQRGRLWCIPRSLPFSLPLSARIRCLSDLSQVRNSNPCRSLVIYICINNLNNRQYRHSRPKIYHSVQFQLEWSSKWCLALKRVIPLGYPSMVEIVRNWVTETFSGSPLPSIQSPQYPKMVRTGLHGLIHSLKRCRTTSVEQVIDSGLFLLSDQLQDWFESLADCLHWNVRQPQKSFASNEPAIPISTRCVRYLSEYSWIPQQLTRL